MGISMESLSPVADKFSSSNIITSMIQNRKEVELGQFLSKTVDCWPNELSDSQRLLPRSEQDITTIGFCLIQRSELAHS